MIEEIALRGQVNGAELHNPVLRQLQRTATDLGTSYARTLVAERERDGAYRALIRKLSAIAALRHGETGKHIERVGVLASHLAALAAQSPEYCATILQAAPLHDIGKILIPDHILKKPGALSETEREIMALHVEAGVLLLDGSAHPVLIMAKEIAQHHHERWDGKGYPRRTSGSDIPLCARIAALVDVFDALSTDRVYRAALPRAEVISILTRGVGTHFDPQLATTLLDRFEEFSHLRDCVDLRSEDVRGPIVDEEVIALGQRLKGR